MLVTNFARSIGGYTSLDENGNGTLSENFITNCISTSGGSSMGEKYNVQNYMCMLLGTGETEPTVGDLKLDTDVTTDLTFLSGQATKNPSDGTVCTFISSFKNNTANTYIIKEIGIGRSLKGYFGNNRLQGMFMRSVLETPVTIAPGESYSFSYTVSLT